MFTTIITEDMPIAALCAVVDKGGRYMYKNIVSYDVETKQAIFNDDGVLSSRVLDGARLCFKIADEIVTRKYKHIIKSPKSGKTSDIIRNVDEDSLIIVQDRNHLDYIERLLKFNRPGLNVKILAAGQSLVANQYGAKKVFIDDLLKFGKDKVAWLHQALATRFTKDLQEVVAYSTPFKTFNKYAYLVGKHSSKIADPNLRQHQINAIQDKVDEMRSYLILDSELVFEELIMDQMEKKKLSENIGYEVFNLMYNLAIFE